MVFVWVYKLKAFQKLFSYFPLAAVNPVIQLHNVDMTQSRFSFIAFLMNLDLESWIHNCCCKRRHHGYGSVKI